MSATPGEFYLGGGTALSRFYLNHRYSDDLDFFLDTDADWVAHIQGACTYLKQEGLVVTPGPFDSEFARISAHSTEWDQLGIKVDFIHNRNPRFGDFTRSDLFPRVDSMRNILSSKLSYISSLEPKSMADIWWICRALEFSWGQMIEEVRKKSIIDEFLISKSLREFDASRLGEVKWIMPIQVGDFLRDRETIIENIITRSGNALAGARSR